MAKKFSIAHLNPYLCGIWGMSVFGNPVILQDNVSLNPYLCGIWGMSLHPSEPYFTF